MAQLYRVYIDKGFRFICGRVLLDPNMIESKEIKMSKENFTNLIYENPLSCESDVKNFVLEGEANISFENGVMRLASKLDPALGQAANYVYWCDADFPSDVMIQWKFKPLAETGLCILFFSALGINGEDIFDKSLRERNGRYDQYHNGDINAFHVSYYRTNLKMQQMNRHSELAI